MPFCKDCFFYTPFVGTDYGRCDKKSEQRTALEGCDDWVTARVMDEVPFSRPINLAFVYERNE